jgi:tetratricopeptide (TPR) repeat protein
MSAYCNAFLLSVAATLAFVATDNKSAAFPPEPITKPQPAKTQDAPSPAEAALSQARQRLQNSEFDLAVQECKKALALEPNKAGALVVLGMALNGKGDYDGAIQEFDKVTGLAGRELAQSRADAYANRSFSLYQKGEYLKAVDSAYFALLEKSDHVVAHNNRALAYIARNQFDKAIQSADRAISADAKAAESYSIRGFAYGAKGNLDQALADQNKALELDPKLAVALQRRGAVHATKGDLDLALRDFNEALQLKADHVDALCDRASVFALKQDYPKAAADLDNAIRLKPNFRKALLRRGQLYLGQGNFDKAIENFDAAIRLKQDDAAAYCFRGYAQHGKREYDLAIKDFTKALGLDSTLAEAYAGRGQTYKSLGKLREAKADQEKLKPPAQTAGKKPAQKKEEPAPNGFHVKSKSVDPGKRTQMLKAAREIDRLIAANYKKHKVEPNPKTTDSQFLRRIYLDITGTIPTYQQTRMFLTTGEPKKRTLLIDELLNSDQYAGHFYNYWADVLRYTDSLNSVVPGEPYRQWIKQSLAEDKPWDKFVHELLCAEGLVWQNPATGYLQRDPGMPLDNMNNTVRIFLGTRIGCAQCHNHPFDRWKQKEFYQMAAFTFGTLNSTAGSDTRYWPKNPHDRLQAEYAAIEQEEEDRRQNSYRFNLLIAKNMMIVNDQAGRKITLPKDYAYADAKPDDIVEPKTLFGAAAEIRAGVTPRRAFARWLTSKDNPRFALTIANRLWKQAFGVGQIEPVDDMMDSTVAENPELMRFLESEMKRLDFDMKEYLRIIFNSETYQRQACFEDLPLGAPYHFPGPMLRRMTAEQVWDSFLTMAVVKPDEYRELRSDVRTDLIGVDLDKVSAAKMLDADNLVNAIAGAQGGRQAKYTYKGTLLARASELPSPVPPSHFLRMFGQSDRELISASSTMGSVPQVLFMFNGPITHMLLEKNSTIYNNVMIKKTVAEGVKAVFWTVLNRDPDDEEAELAREEIKQNGPAGYGNVIWSLVNTREFLFIQ